MKREQVVTLFGVVLLVIGCIGIGVTVNAVHMSGDKVNALALEEEALKRQIVEAKSRNSAVLSQATDIVGRVVEQGSRVATWMNDRRDGKADIANSPEILYNDIRGCILYSEDYYPRDTLPGLEWSLTSHDLVETDKVPTLWEMKNANGETLVVAYAEYDVETGKYLNGFHGTIFDRVDWAAAVDGNTPA